jgi:hypothetical protein
MLTRCGVHFKIMEQQNKRYEGSVEKFRLPPNHLKQHLKLTIKSEFINAGYKKPFLTFCKEGRH